jgi:hypothetical protein
MTAIDAPRQRQIEQTASMWQSVVAQVPTLFGKLLWVASFRVLDSNRYRHPALEQMFAPEVTNRVLEECHRQCFQAWLALGIEKQHQDFVEYIEPLGFFGDPKDFLEDAGRRLIPATAIKPQRLLFETDLAVVLELLD